MLELTCFFLKNIGIFFEAARVFSSQEEARAPRISTRHLNPSHWKCYPLFFSGQYSWGSDSRKARTRPLHARSAYAMRVGNGASVAYAAVSARGTWAV
jgi:hypothetical protein